MPRARRPRKQAERVASMRTRLFEATIEALIELGYARTTTTEVCRRAGVSQGGLFNHFASKAELVSAAAEFLFAELIADYRRAFTEAAGESDRVAAATRTLWEIFQTPRLQATLELSIAARTDPELAASLEPVRERHGANLRQQARELFPEAAASSPDFEPMLDVVLSAVQGAALGPDPAGSEARLLPYLIRLARAGLAAA